MNKVSLIRFPDSISSNIQNKNLKGIRGEKGPPGDSVYNVNIGEERFNREMYNNLIGSSGKIAVEGERMFKRSFRKIVSDERYGVFRNIKSSRGESVIYQPYNAYGVKCNLLEDTEISPGKWNLLSLKQPEENCLSGNMDIFSVKCRKYKDEDLSLLTRNIMTDPYEFVNDYRVKMGASIEIENIKNIISFTIALVPLIVKTNEIDISSCLRYYSEEELKLISILYQKIEGSIILKTEEFDISAFTPTKQYTIAIYFEGEDNVVIKKDSFMTANLSGYDK